MERITQELEETSFNIVKGLGGLATAFEARIGDSERKTVAVLAEYDALPEIGHACGHNIIAAIAVGAVLGLEPAVEDLDFKLRLIGTPAEEGGGGKIHLLEAGVFEGVDAALMVHPGPVDLEYMPTLATTRFGVRFSGRGAHASAFPERGINAADAATISQVAIGLLRQQLPATTRVHGHITKAGDAPNVIPSSAELDYLIRAEDLDSLGVLEEKVKACFDAGAVGSGADIEIERTMPTYAELRPDPFLSASYRSNAGRLGRTFREVDERVRRASGSTDMGNISQHIPSAHPMIGLGRESGTIHTEEFARASVSAAGDRAVVEGALALASTVVDFVLEEEDG